MSTPGAADASHPSLTAVAPVTPAAADRESLRARLFLRSVLPLVRVVMAEQEKMARMFRGVRAAVQLEVAGSDVGACLVMAGGELSVEQGIREHAEVRCTFPDVRGLNRFFAGQGTLPRLNLGALRHPLLLVKVARLLSTLQILAPEVVTRDPEARALRVKLILYLATRALCELYRGGHPQMVELVDESPDRIYQWTVGSVGSEGTAATDGTLSSDTTAALGGALIGAYLRMRHGQIKAGRGVYPHRRPFVHFRFPSVDAALSVLTASGSQMEAVRGGNVLALGCPEYTRKISILMQKVDQLLMTG